MSSDDPTVTDPDLYRVIFENDRVRVLEYRDRPAAGTSDTNSQVRVVRDAATADVLSRWQAVAGPGPRRRGAGRSGGVCLSQPDP